MRCTPFFLSLLLCSCAGAGIHTGADIPISWSIGQANSPDASVSPVCQATEPQQCVLERSTNEKPKFASLMLHLWGPAPTTFKGYVLATYLNEPDPRQYRSEVNVTSQGKETHHSFFAKVTSTPGRYSVTVHLEQARDGSAVSPYDVTVPVIVK